MRTLVFLQEIGLHDTGAFGEEAAALGNLCKAEVPVAPAFVLPSAAYVEFLSTKQARHLLSLVSSSDLVEFRREIAGIPFPPRLAKEIEEFYRLLSGPRDTFVSIRAGNIEYQVGGSAELLSTIKKIWVEHLSSVQVRGGNLYKETLPILVQQETTADFFGSLFTSAEELPSSDLCLVEVNHPEGKERFVFEKSTGRGVRRTVSGLVGDQTDARDLSELSVWANKIEQVLNGAFMLDWCLYKGQFVFGGIKRVFLPRTPSSTLTVWAEVSGNIPDSITDVGGLVARDVQQAIKLAQRFSQQQVLFFLEPFNFDQLDSFREGKRKVGLKNLHLILPPVRTVDGMRELKRYLSGEKIQRGANLKFFFQAVYPSNVILLDQFLQVGVDGVVLNEEEMAKSLLGTKEKVEPDESLLWAVKETVRQCRTNKVEFLYRAGQPRDWLLLELLRLGVGGIIVPQHQYPQYVDSLREAEEKRLYVHG